MFCLWQPEHFSSIVSQIDWEHRIAPESSVATYIEQGFLVPINLGVDGAFQFLVRARGGEFSLSERESRYVAVTSDPYLLIAHGSVVLGGLDAIGVDLDLEELTIPLAPGRHAVTIHLVDWSAEPGSMLEDGEPGANALPDFIVEIRPESSGVVFRTSVETFDRPE
ncbi:hypothetical protein [Micromonospora sp. NPDC005174]|uniref:hypothetical protein n=1 Tax=Micromonospora sp. NPDC005174 TaxID=3157018 RepID=UPI0033B0B663